MEKKNLIFNYFVAFMTFAVAFAITDILTSGDITSRNMITLGIFIPLSLGCLIVRGLKNKNWIFNIMWYLGSLIVIILASSGWLFGNLIMILIGTIISISMYIIRKSYGWDGMYI